LSFVCFGIGSGVGYGRDGGGEEELAEVLLVEGDGVRGGVAAVGAGAELGADGYLGGQAHD
jgi:hypothetical protein